MIFFAGSGRVSNYLMEQSFWNISTFDCLPLSWNFCSAISTQFSIHFAPQPLEFYWPDHDDNFIKGNIPYNSISTDQYVLKFVAFQSLFLCAVG